MLNKAIENYDREYLHRLANGEDPNELGESYAMGNEGMPWKNSKLGDFSKNFGDSINMGNDNDDSIQNRPKRVKTVKYTTFDEHNEVLSNDFEDVEYETDRK